MLLPALSNAKEQAKLKVSVHLQLLPLLSSV